MVLRVGPPAIRAFPWIKRSQNSLRISLSLGELMRSIWGTELNNAWQYESKCFNSFFDLIQWLKQAASTTKEQRTQTAAGKPWEREDFNKVQWCFQILNSKRQKDVNTWLFKKLDKELNTMFVIILPSNQNLSSIWLLNLQNRPPKTQRKHHYKSTIPSI